MELLVYKIVNGWNNKVYIGSTNNPTRRWRQHLSQLQRGTHHCIGLQRAFDKYGLEFFSFEKQEVVRASVDLLAREQTWITHFWRRAYNRCPIVGSPLGVKKTADEIERSARFHRGRKRSAETRARMSKSMRGNTNGLAKARPSCGQGHAMTGDNIYRYTLSGGQQRYCCRICQRTNGRTQELKRRARRPKGITP